MSERKAPRETDFPLAERQKSPAKQPDDRRRDNRFDLPTRGSATAAAGREGRENENYTNLVFHIEFEFLSSELY